MEELSKSQRRKLRVNIKKQLELISFSELEVTIINRLNLKLLNMIVEKSDTLNKRTKCIRCKKHFEGVIPILGHCQKIHRIGEPNRIKLKPVKLKATKLSRSRTVIFEHKSVHSSLSGITSSRNWKKTK